MKTELPSVTLAATAFADLPYRVEPMRVADIDEVLVIDRQSFSTPWSHNAYRYEIEKNDAAHYLVLRPRQTAAVLSAGGNGHQGGKAWDRVRRWLGTGETVRKQPILGYGGLWLMYDEAHISTVAVRPEWRGHGLGELLLIAMLDQSLRLNAACVTLEVRVTNTRAQQLYKKYEFEVVGRRRGYYTDNGEDALLMTTPSLQDRAYLARLVDLAAALRQRLLSEAQPV